MFGYTDSNLIDEMLYYYVSYNKGDYESVERILGLLADAGIPIWYDREVLGQADKGQTSLKALKKSSAVVSFLSDETFTSADPFTQSEHDLAVQEGIKIIPVLLNGFSDEPQFLNNLIESLGLLLIREDNFDTKKKLTYLKVGDTLAFGSYPQGYTRKRKPIIKPIVWKILDIKDRNLLLLSEKSLFTAHTIAFSVREEGSWVYSYKKSEIRAFLNGYPHEKLHEKSFYEIAFGNLDEKSKNRIVPVRIITDPNPFCLDSILFQRGIEKCDEEDRIFLLSYQEALRYLGYGNPDYRKEDGLKKRAFIPFRSLNRTVPDEHVAGDWFLRTGGESQIIYPMQMMIYDSGRVLVSGASRAGIRPAMWLRYDEENDKL